MNKSHDINKKRTEMEKCHGRVMDSEIRAFMGSTHIFIVNYAEFRRLMDLLASPDFAVKIMKKENREDLIVIHKEALRLLHNFLASAKSLVDHTRVFVRKHYSSKQFEELYSLKIKDEFANNELSNFIQDIRNYTMHKELPFASISFRFDSDEKVNGELLLDKETLKKWDKWSKGGRAYLEKQNDKISLYQIMDDYNNKVSNFYRWFFESIFEIHRADFDEYKEKREEFKELLIQAGLYKK